MLPPSSVTKGRRLPFTIIDIRDEPARLFRNALWRSIPQSVEKIQTWNLNTLLTLVSNGQIKIWIKKIYWFRHNKASCKVDSLPFIINLTFNLIITWYFQNFIVSYEITSQDLSELFSFLLKKLIPYATKQQHNLIIFKFWFRSVASCQTYYLFSVSKNCVRTLYKD